MSIKFEEVTNMEIDGVDMVDYPDFCDAFIINADKLDGTPLSEEELEDLNMLEETSAYVCDNAYESIL